MDPLMVAITMDLRQVTSFTFYVKAIACNANRNYKAHSSMAKVLIIALKDISRISAIGLAHPANRFIVASTTPVWVL